MSRIADVFKDNKHKALIAYVTVGYPDIESTLKVVPLLADCGCDIVELGIPFSDPLADGATIQKASYNALRNGVTPELCLETASELRRKVEIPLVFMTYYNPVYSYGLERFCTACTRAGVQGLIVPDLIPDEGAELEGIAAKQGIDLIYLLSPASGEDRIRLVARHSRGFIYLVSVTGVTGARNALPADLNGLVSRVKKSSNLPVCVGFGISTTAQARQISAIADGVIVGSKIIQLMETDASLDEVRELAKGLRAALNA
jgi:tryptophan synthase alpha chain